MMPSPRAPPDQIQGRGTLSPSRVTTSDYRVVDLRWRGKGVVRSRLQARTESVGAPYDEYVDSFETAVWISLAGFRTVDVGFVYAGAPDSPGGSSVKGFWASSTFRSGGGWDGGRGGWAGGF